MFGQVVQGRVVDRASVREAMESWALAPEAGWMGGTAGVTEDGRFVAVLRFESSGHARAAALPDRWRDLLGDEVSIRNGTRIDVFLSGDPTRARFVQVVQGRVTDLDAVRRHKDALQDELRVHLPCLLGTVTVEHTGGRFTRVLHFSSEAEARAGERDAPPDVRRLDEQAVAFLAGPPEFLDLREPWLFGAQPSRA